MSWGLLVLVWLLVPCLAPAQTGRLGAFWTEAEQAIWLARTTAGPYRSPGTVSTNSPGDWDRLVANANTFVADPSQDRVVGIPTERCITIDDQGTANGMPGGPGTGDGNHGWLILSSAFVSAVTSNLAYATPVITELLAQAGTAGTDHTNTVRFCTEAYGMQGGALIVWPLWLAKLALAYDYAKPAASAGQRTTIEAWLSAAGVYWDGAGALFVRDRFPNRDTYTTDAEYVVPPVSGAQGNQHLLYHGGPLIRGFHTAWSNTKLATLSSTAIIGVVTGNAALQASAKRFVKEALMFATWPEGGMDDLQRNFGGTGGCVGLDYIGDQLGSMAIIADVLARNGDDELYTYTTTHGWLGTEGNDQRSGTPKSLRNSILWWYTYADGTLVRYAEGHNGDAAYKIDTLCGTTAGVTDVRFAPLGNVYFKDATIRTHYLRTAAGMPAYPTNPACCGQSMWGGRHGMFPGLLFQFGYPAGGEPDPYTQQIVALRPEVTRCGVSCLSDPTTVRVVLDAKDAPPLLPASGATGFTARVATVNDPVTAAACGTVFTGYTGAQLGCTLTLTTGVSTCAEAVDVSYSEGAGNVTDSQGPPQELVAVTQHPCTNAASVLHDDVVVSATAPSAGRPVTALFTSVLPESEADSYVTPTSPAVLVFDLGAPTALESWAVRGDNAATVQCGTLTVAWSDNATDWTTFAGPTSCHVDRQTLVTLAATPASHRYWRATFTEQTASTGVQVFFLAATVEAGTPPPEPPPVAAIVDLHGVTLTGVTVGAP